MSELPDHVRRNREDWDRHAANWEKPGRFLWSAEPDWGVWRVPASQVHISPGPLATARQLQREFGIDFELLEGNAEQVPYPDASFDFAISEHGASICSTKVYHPTDSLEWAQKWPCEEVWKVRRR